MIRSLQTWRGVGALMIFAHHFGFHGSVVAAMGDAAVCFFMMLSGYVLGAAFLPRLEAGEALPSTRSFMLRRLARIYPLYLAGLLAALLLKGFGEPPVAMLLDLLMMQSWVPDPAIHFSGNGPAWFVSDLMVCYLLFLPMVWLLHSSPRRFVRAGMLYLALYFTVVFLTPPARVNDIIYIQPLMELAPFAIGVWLRRATTGMPPLRGGWALTVAIALWVGCMAVYDDIDPRFASGCMWWVPSGLLIAVLTATEAGGGMAARVAGCRAGVVAGNASFAFYILHGPWITASRILLRKADISVPLGVEFVVSGVLLGVMAIAVHRLAEVPLSRWLDRMVTAWSRSGTHR